MRSGPALHVFALFLAFQACANAMDSEPLKDPDPTTRRKAIRSQVEAGHKLPLETVQGLLADLDADVRAEAVYYCDTLRVRQAVPSLEPLLKDPDARIRRGVAGALGNLGSRGSCKAISPLLEDKDPEVRSAAVWALGMLRDTASTGAITVLLKDKDPKVRRMTAHKC